MSNLFDRLTSDERQEVNKRVQNGTLDEVSVLPYGKILEPFSNRKCKDCNHSERWKCGSKIFWYCGKLQSKRTDNGKLKIKANSQACQFYSPMSINPAPDI